MTATKHDSPQTTCVRLGCIPGWPDRDCPIHGWSDYPRPEEGVRMTTQRSVVVALAFAIAPAHRKLRYGTNHPEKASQPNALAFSIAEALVKDQSVVIESDGEADQ